MATRSNRFVSRLFLDINMMWILLSLVQTRTDKFEKAALYLQLGLPSTKIQRNCTTKINFSKMLFKPEEFEKAGFAI